MNIESSVHSDITKTVLPFPNDDDGPSVNSTMHIESPKHFKPVGTSSPISTNNASDCMYNPSCIDSTINNATSISHLSYIGDSIIGKNVNI